LRPISSLAGFEPKKLHPVAVVVIKEVGLDIFQKKPKNVSDLVRTEMIWSPRK